MMLLESDWLCHHSDTQHRMLSIVTRHNCPSVSFSPVRLLLQFSDLSLQECMNDDVIMRSWSLSTLPLYPPSHCLVLIYFSHESAAYFHHTEGLLPEHIGNLDIPKSVTLVVVPAIKGILLLDK